MTTDLGGKLVNVSMPDITISNPVMHYGYNIVASLIDADGHLATGSDASLNMLNLAKKVAATDVTVFVNGPTGTGKEVLSRFVHFHSARKDKPFVGINCAAIPENMLEAILFGHEKGSFTGATDAKAGQFELCHKGTLFLDEIGDMGLPTQTKILRAIQEGEIQRVGATKTKKVDVRLIAATHKNLEEMVKTFD